MIRPIKKTTLLLQSYAVALLLTTGIASHADSFRPFTADSFEEIKASFADSEFLVGLWSVDCPPCLVELDMMGEVLKLNPDLPFVLISTDPIEDRELAAEFLEDYDLHQIESWMFADRFTERLRYTIDPNWYGELPRSYFFSSGHQMSVHSGVMTLDILKAWFSHSLNLN